MIRTPGKIDDFYLAWVRGEPCELASMLDPCSSSSIHSCCEAHHVTGRGMGGSKRDDRDAVPLCKMHHDRIHSKGAKDTHDRLLIASHRLLKSYLDRVVIPLLKQEITVSDIF